jgi:integrase
MKELFELDLNENPRLEVVLDQFLVLCWTGLRISDFKSFNDIPKDDDVITITNKKTGELAHIPIFNQTRLILNKYNGRFPKTISEQKMREYLKEIGLMIPSLKRSIEVTFTKGGVTQKEIKKRYELLSLHVARRTCATHLASINIPYHEIMLITGHKSLKNFEIYIKVNKKNVLKSMISKVSDYENSLKKLEMV